MKRTLIALVAVVVLLLSAAAAQAKVVSANGVTIQSCVVNESGGATNGINIVYWNAHNAPATEVDFLVGYRGHRVVLIDRGTFSKGAQINHNLTNGLVGYAWNGPNPNVCTVQRVVLDNGRVFGP